MADPDRIEVPTPFEVGRTNCYVFAGDGVTLLDPGPATDEAYETLVAGLRERGYDPDEVDRVLITHPHMDHFGLANRIATDADAEVLAHTDAVDHLTDPVDYFEREAALFSPFLTSMGVPEQLVDTVVGLPEPYMDFQAPVDVDRKLGDGDRVDVWCDLRVKHTPGHAPGSVCFVDAAARVIYTGDHVLSHISPNPLLTIAPGSDGERTRSLPTYVDSLEKLRSVDADIGYGGHGDPVTDLRGRIAEIIDHHRSRKERIAELLTDEGPATAYRIMTELFPDLPATEMFAGMSEVIGHLDLLEDEGRVQIVSRDGARRYKLRRSG
jgi:glyoxylase-like metal-dependent hydrolase (beta-lactamase superfamily II)